MKRKLAPVLLVLLGISPNWAWADSACNIRVETEMSESSRLNPIVGKLTITRAKPLAAGEICELIVGDQILEVNQHVVPGESALKVSKYFKEVKDGELITFKIKRGMDILVIRTK